MSVQVNMFRPGRNSVIQRFMAVVAEETTYPGDWLSMSTTAATSQGPNGDGVFDGKQLASGDMVYAVKAVTGSAEGLQIGVAYGVGMSAPANIVDVSRDAIAPHSILTVMTHGIHPGSWVDSSTAAGNAVKISATAGQGATSAMDTTATCDVFMGLALTADSAYTRDVASTQATCFVRCGG